MRRVLVAKFLTTLETSARIEKIVREAKEKLILMSPYLKMNKMFYDRLKDADTNGIKITFIYGKQGLVPDQLEQLSKLKSLEIFYCENLHAKCYCNEETMVITSLNLLEFSQSHNREMGILIKKQMDLELYNNAFIEIKSIINSSNIEKQSKINRSYDQSKKESWVVIQGDIQDACFCIRCDNARAFTADPYCKKCYYEWKDAKYPKIIENFCWACGGPYGTTFEKPLCEDCYRGR